MLILFVFLWKWRDIKVWFSSWYHNHCLKYMSSCDECGGNVVSEPPVPDILVKMHKS
ncbi:hypothetical protein OIU76_002367 [Salix suchowensis]|nr:hypothetical protein OIU76_002367 [Salix suchowensis]